MTNHLFRKSLVLFSLLVGACAPSPEMLSTQTATAQTAIAAAWTNTPIFTATHTPTATSTFTPTATSTKTSTPTRTSTSTIISTPLPPLCELNATFADPLDEELPGYVDILEASSKLEDNVLEITFRLREYPESIMINQTRLGNIEYAWRGGVDIDRNLETGLEFAHGAEYFLQAFYFQQGYIPKVGSMEELLEGSIWKATSRKSFQYQSQAKLTVNKEKGLITLRGAIVGISSEAFIYFDTFAYNPSGEPFRDDVPCRRE